MLLLRIILYPFSLLYGLIIGVRNWFFNNGMLSVTKVDTTVISIGNLSVGGTGKTPHVDYLLKALSEKYKTAVLLRGYSRKTKGFLIVDEQSKVQEVGDEALNYAKKFKNRVEVAVCEKRAEGAKKLLQEHPDLELILLDDAYQHRYIHRDCNILLTEYNRPFYKDFMVPTGRLREFRRGRNRADIVIVTKMPKSITQENKDQFIARLKMKKEVPIFFSSIQYGGLIDVETKAQQPVAKNILLVTGIGNPEPLVAHLESQSNVKHLQFDDHHDYTVKDIEKIHKLFDNFASTDKIIVTTEKDAMRLMETEIKPLIQSYPWCYQEIKVAIDNGEILLKDIDGYFNSNQ